MRTGALRGAAPLSTNSACSGFTNVRTSWIPELGCNAPGCRHLRIGFSAPNLRVRPMVGASWPKCRSADQPPKICAAIRKPQRMMPRHEEAIFTRPLSRPTVQWSQIPRPLRNVDADLNSRRSSGPRPPGPQTREALPKFAKSGFMRHCARGGRLKTRHVVCRKNKAELTTSEVREQAR